MRSSGEGCELARRYDVATVCVKPYAVPLARDLLTGSDVGVCAVIGFPHGNSTPAHQIRRDTAGHRRWRDRSRHGHQHREGAGRRLGLTCRRRSRPINHATVTQGAILKVIFETDYLEDRHIIRLCEICSEHHVAFVKTSTGYGFVKQPNGDYNYQGATDHVLALMRQHSAPEVQIKAAGGVRTLDDLLRVPRLGVTRIGATATAAILEDAKRRGYC